MGNESGGVHWHEQSVSRGDRETLNGHTGCVVWFTGLSGSGKSTVANLVDRTLHGLGVHTFLLDGDNVRHGLNATPSILCEFYGEAYADRFGLGFSKEDRTENIRRIGAVAGLFAAAGVIVLTAFVSPYRSDRDADREQLGAGTLSRFLSILPSKFVNNVTPKASIKKRVREKLKTSQESTILTSHRPTPNWC